MEGLLPVVVLATIAIMALVAVLKTLWEHPLVIILLAGGWLLFSWLL